ncbi:MAG: SH3 domain-containing protein [Gammaproteobacteria bacterium]|nr:SH3 domain-containing protein [Gammaproteobacteria bacterium]
MYWSTFCRGALLGALLFLHFVTAAEAKDQHYVVVVAEPFLEMHTGPGRGYPRFHVAERGEQVEVLKRRTDWFKVRTARGVEGWSSREQISRTLEPSGAPAQISAPSRLDYLERRTEGGVLLGDFGGANVLAAYGAFHMTRNLSLELWGSDINGRFSSGWMINANLVHQPWPEWRISPYFTLGTGVVRIEPQATLVDVEDRTDQLAHAGIGLRMHVSRNFMLRAEFKSYVVFTSREENEDVNEWKAGFAFFF